MDSPPTPQSMAAPSVTAVVRYAVASIVMHLDVSTDACVCT